MHIVCFLNEITVLILRIVDLDFVAVNPNEHAPIVLGPANHGKNGRRAEWFPSCVLSFFELTNSKLQYVLNVSLLSVSSVFFV